MRGSQAVAAVRLEHSEDARTDDRARAGSPHAEWPTQACACLRVEAPDVGARELVDAKRRVAGGTIREAWDAEPIETDAQIHATSWRELGGNVSHGGRAPGTKPASNDGWAVEWPVPEVDRGARLRLGRGATFA
jgi:hypothetical protein